MEDFSKIIELINNTKNNVNYLVNKELIALYWNIGEYLSKKIKSDGWGKNTIHNLAKYLESTIENSKGFSERNLWRMKQFYETYIGNEILPPLVAELNWATNIEIMSRAKTDEEREFYIRIAIKERYSKRELARQIDSSLFERIALSNANSKDKQALVPKANDFFAIRDSYMLEFLSLPENFKEKDLQKQIILNLKKFILEFGKDFIFMGEEYKVQVGNEDFYIDLLFYHRELNCLVAFELKIGKFKPEYLGKMNFYLEALDKTIKKEQENPSIGIILCASYDTDVVEYSLNRNTSPTLIAKYKTKLIDKEILQTKLREFYDLAQENIDEYGKTAIEEK